MIMDTLLLPQADKAGPELGVTSHPQLRPAKSSRSRLSVDLPPSVTDDVIMMEVDSDSGPDDSAVGHDQDQQKNKEQQKSQAKTDKTKGKTRSPKPKSLHHVQKQQTKSPKEPQPSTADHMRCAPFSGCVCQIQHKYEGDAVMEVFCPPRLVAEAQSRGLQASISLDKDTGWDGSVASEKQRAQHLLRSHQPWLLLTSPECRMYSIMQRNQKKIPKEKWDDHLDFSMDLLIEQGQSGRKFVFEHPSGAASWSRHSVLRVMEEVPDAKIVSFAQCRFGLKAPNGQPLQKLTKFLTNSKAVIQVFHNAQCVCAALGLEHAKIEGSMQGHKMSRWAQKYPPLLVSSLIDCCQREMP